MASQNAERQPEIEPLTPPLHTPQPGARKEMPSSPPSLAFIVGALAVIAGLVVTALIAGYW